MKETSIFFTSVILIGCSLVPQAGTRLEIEALHSIENDGVQTARAGDSDKILKS